MGSKSDGPFDILGAKEMFVFPTGVDDIWLNASGLKGDNKKAIRNKAARAILFSELSIKGSKGSILLLTVKASTVVVAGAMARNSNAPVYKPFNKRLTK